jgi:hypothetical protein
VEGYTNNALSNYNGGSVQYKRIDRRGLTTDVAFTYSHALDDVSNGGNAQLPYNGGSLGVQLTSGLPSRLMYASSDYDIRHNLVADLVYAEPYHFGNKLVDTAAGGWTVGGKAYWRSGEPFSVFNDNAGAALYNGTGGTTVLAEVLNNNFSHSCNSFFKPCFQTPGIFNGTGLTVNTSTSAVIPTSFTQPVQTNFGNVPRNSFLGPHYSDVDMNVFKDIFKKEDLDFQVGAQAYNILNHVDFGPPNNDASNPSSLGRIASDISAPTSPYGQNQQGTVSGRTVVVQGRLMF